MRGTPLVLLLVLLACALAGCTNGAPDKQQDAGEDEQDDPPQYSMETFYLNDDMELTLEAPESSGSVPAGDFVATWATGIGEHPLFERPLREGDDLRWVSPTNASVTLYITTEHPVLPAEGALPDVAVWTGSGHHLPLVGSTTLDGPLEPGEVVEVTFDLPGPEDQPPILAWQGIGLMVTVTMTQSDEHDVRILTGGEHASHVAVETRPFRPGEFVPVEGDGDEHRFSGTLPLFERVVGEADEPDVNYADHEIPVPEEGTQFILLVQATGGYTVDMDIQLMDEEGRTITWGVTPYPVEQLWLLAEALEPYQGQTLTLRISNHLGLLMEYEAVYLMG